MTSGVWRGASQVYQPTWEHYITVVQPPVVTTDTAMLVISGGSTGSLPSDSLAQTLVPFSLATGSVVALIQAVPNEPLNFTDESRSRSEDAIIAYSYDKYMTGYEEGNADMTWPALLPMTRAAVRAMDTVQDFMSNKPRNPVPVKHFVVAGASKRGWTTWLSAAADKRVTAIVPIVIDVLNMAAQMQHHFNAYGFYSSAIQDYVDSNVFERLGTPEGASLLKIVDPYSYLNRLTMPKFIANSTGDQFFLPDSSQFYFNQLSGKNYLYYAPNTDHGLASGSNLGVDEGTLNSILAFYISFIRGIQPPQYSWTLEGDNQIVVHTTTRPTEVRLWQATNPTARDFRLQTIGEQWTSTVLESDCPCDQLEGEGAPEDCNCAEYNYVGQVPIPAEGWTAFFVQMVYPGPDPTMEDVPFAFSTQVRVVPDVYPVSK
jgi:PhoPQ-activated pathogenicity-related protein